MISFLKNSTNNLFIDLPIEAILTIPKILNTAVGILAAAVSVLTIGKFQTINNFSVMNVSKETDFLSSLYFRMVRVFNPSLKKIDSKRNGIFSSNITIPIFKAAYNTRKSDQFFDRHVVSRLQFAAGTVSSVVTCVADLALGILAGGISLVPCLGRCQQINNFAIRQLKFNIFTGLCSGIRRTVNPHQNV